MAVETHIHAFPRHVAAKTYPEAVPVYDSAAKRIRIGDGSTVGGTEVPNMTDLNNLGGRVTALESAVGSFESAAETIIGDNENDSQEQEGGDQE